MILCLPLASLATDYYWIGGTTGAQTFSSASNWSTTPGGSAAGTAPGTGDVAIFQATNTLQIGAISFTDPISVGAIVVDSISGGVSPDVTFSNTLTLSGTTVGPIANPTGTIGAYSSPTGLVANYGTLTVTSNLSIAYDLHTRNTGKIDLTGTTTFSGTTTLDADGSNGIYFNDVVVNSDPGNVGNNVNLIGRKNTTFNYYINGNLTMTTGGIRNSSVSDSTAEVKLAGNFSSTVIYTESTANLRFIGSSDQKINLAPGSEARWGGNIIFDVNPNPVDGSNNPLPPAKILLNSPVVIDNPGQAVIFNYGIVVSNSTDALIFTDPSATTSGANNNSYVDGYVRRTGTTEFVFPIGNGGYYAPVSLTGSTGNFGAAIPQVETGVDPTYQATYVRVDPLANGYPNNAPQPTDGLSTPTLLSISQAEYFKIDYVGTGTISSTNAPYAWFSYSSARSGGITSVENLYIVDWTAGSNWELNGSSGTLTTDAGITYIQSGQILTAGNVDPAFTLATNTPLLNPLPVKWLSFTGTAVKGVVELNWSTASELDNRDFTIQRSADGNNFQSIGTVEGKGTTTAVSSYAFTDQQPLKGIAYYRIKQTDINGKFSYSSVIRISSNGQNGGALRLYPNPAVTSVPLKVEYSNFRNQLVTVSIINAAGIVVHKELVNFGTDSRATLNISRLQRGSYFVSMVSGSQRQTIPFVIQ